MRRHPDWLKVKIGGGENFTRIKHILRDCKLHTICEEAKCPNIADCFGSGTAAFLILGDICTRNCGYCNVKHGTPLSLDSDEPRKVAESVQKLGLKYVVITSVTRDDLMDGGASFFYDTVQNIKQLVPDCKTEVLIPDFNGNLEALRTVLFSKPDVVNHNIEVVKDLFPSIRPHGDYSISLQVFKNIKKIDSSFKTKSGLMIGLGESWKQIIATLKDLRDVNVDFLTIGQYLQPSKNHVEIKKYYTPSEFEELKHIAFDLGFQHVESAPLVRSSYHAERLIEKI